LQDNVRIKFDNLQEQRDKLLKYFPAVREKYPNFEEMVYDPPNRFLLYLHGKIARVAHAIGHGEQEDERDVEDYNFVDLRKVTTENFSHLIHQLGTIKEKRGITGGRSGSHRSKR